MKMKNLRSNDNSVEQNFDMMESTILRIISQDSRRTLNDIGVETGLSLTACWTCIKRLEAVGGIKH